MAWADAQRELERIANTGSLDEIERLWAQRNQGIDLSPLYQPYVERGRARIARSNVKRESFANLANFQRALQPYEKIMDTQARKLAALGNWGGEWDGLNERKTMWSEVVRPGLELGAATAAAGAAVAFAPAAVAYAGKLAGVSAAELAAQAGSAYAAYQATKPRMPERPNGGGGAKEFPNLETPEPTFTESPMAGRGPAGSGSISTERFTTGTRVHGG